MNRISAFFLFAAFASACTTPQVKEISKKERAELDQKLGMSLAPRFEASRTFRKDKVVLRYLDEMAGSLSRPFPDLKLLPLEVFVIKEKAWDDYSLPGNRLYLSSSLLNSLRFENEIAAAVALELGNLTRRNVAARFPKREKSVDPLANDWIFQYPEEARLGALEDAMEMLYQAGYDPRGMVTLLGRFADHPQRSPYPEELLSKMIESARRIIALHAPLRNPIVRSEKYLAIAKRMQNL